MKKAIQAGLLLVVAVLLVGCEMEHVRGYSQGFAAGARFASEAFLRTNAYLGPLVVSGDACISNILIISLMQPQGLVINGTNACKIDIKAAQIYIGD